MSSVVGKTKGKTEKQRVIEYSIRFFWHGQTETNRSSSKTQMISAHQNMFSTSLALPIRWRRVSLSEKASGKMARR